MAGIQKRRSEDDEPRWEPETDNEEELCATVRLGRRQEFDRYCVHLKHHDGDHHFEGDLK